MGRWLPRGAVWPFGQAHGVFQPSNPRALKRPRAVRVVQPLGLRFAAPVQRLPVKQLLARQHVVAGARSGQRKDVAVAVAQQHAVRHLRIAVRMHVAANLALGAPPSMVARARVVGCASPLLMLHLGILRNGSAPAQVTQARRRLGVACVQRALADRGHARAVFCAQAPDAGLFIGNSRFYLVIL